MKRCYSCKEEKDRGSFAKNRSKKDGLQDTCKECRKAYHKDYYQKNKETFLARNRKWHAANKKSANARSRAWRKSNPERKREYARKWNKHKYQTDMSFRLKSILRARLHKHLKYRKTGKTLKKAGSAVRDLGCSIEELISYLEARFEPGMTWENHGKLWEVDHIRCLSSFDLTDRKQFLIACNYRNLQPLELEAHLAKTQRELEDEEVQLGDHSRAANF